jgi:hypothetical protein
MRIGLYARVSTKDQSCELQQPAHFWVPALDQSLSGKRFETSGASTGE